MNDKKLTAVVLLDMSRAFESLDHHILISKLKHHILISKLTGASVAKWLTHLPFTSKVAGSNLNENFSM